MTQTAKTYGDSLYELTRDEQLSAEILLQLQMMVSLMQQNPQFVTLLTLPSLPMEQRLQIADEAFRDRVHPYLLNFLKILTQRGTVSQLPGCAKEFVSRYHEDNGILEAVAVTAKPLDSALEQKLREKLQAVTGKTVELSVREDADVLGGIRLEMDGKRLDGTARHRLDELQARLQGTVL